MGSDNSFKTSKGGEEMIRDENVSMNFKAYVNYYDKANEPICLPYQLCLMMGQEGSVAATLAILLRNARSVGRKVWPKKAHRMSVYIESDTSTFHMCEQGAKR